MLLDRHSLHGPFRKRMDDLITPPKELDPQERVMQTMELQTDTQLQVEKFGEKMTYWDQTLAPQEPAENTDDSQVHIQTIISIVCWKLCTQAAMILSNIYG